jgi:hypothetical protein
MADFAQKNDLDLRFGGSTLGDFGYFYDVELPWIFKCINSIRKNQVCPPGDSVEPAAHQFKVEDEKIYMRNTDNDGWVLLMDLATRGGVLELGEEILITSGILNEGESVLKNTDLATDSLKGGKIAVYNSSGYIDGTLRTADIPASDATAQQKVGKVVVYDSNGKVPGAVMQSDLATDSVMGGKVAVYNQDGVLPANITGSAASMGGKRVNAAGIEDGQVLAFDEATNTWLPSDRFAGVGQGKTLALMDYKGAIGSYNGGAATQLDMPVGTLLPSSTYAVGEVALTNQLPTGTALICVGAGTTPATIPALSEEEEET